MKHTLVRCTLLFSLLFSLFLFPTAAVSAAGPGLLVSGITNPINANGTYVWAGTYSGYDYWSLTVGPTTYVLYNDVYGAGPDRYWNLDTDFDDEGAPSTLFYSSSPSTALTPTGLSWTQDSGTGSLIVATGIPSPEISVVGNGVQIMNGSTVILTNAFTNFGAAKFPGETAARMFTINNGGSAPLTLAGPSPYVVISGANAGSFAVTTIPSASIPASTGTTTFGITFTPSFEGYHNAVVTIHSNDSDEGEFTFAIQGYGYVARDLLVTGITEPAAANGTYLHQGRLNQFQYWKHATLNYYIYLDVYLGSAYWNIDTNTDDAQVLFFKGSETGTPVGLTGWGPDTSLDPDPAGSPVISYAVAAPEIDLYGNGVMIAINDNTPSFPDHTMFGSVDVSGGSRTRTYTIQNTGGQALTLTSVTLGGSGAGEFSKTDPTLASVPAYGSTTFTVTFDPTSEGTKTATLTVVSNDSDESNYVFTISGDAYTPKNLIVSDITTPAAANGVYLYLGELNEFQYWKHETLNYYIFNDEYTSSYFWNLDVDTDDTDMDYLFFTTSQAVAPVGLAGWQANTTAGFESAGPPTIVYAGPEMDVKGGGVSIASGSLVPSPANDTDFGAVSAAAGSAAHTFTIYNTGYEALNLTGAPQVQISGTHAAEFTVTAQPATPVTALTGTSVFTIEFDPAGGGVRSAAVSIANNDSNENPYTFTIQGTGLVAPTLTTAAASGITSSAAVLGGTISSDGGDPVTERGVVYSSTNTAPTIGAVGVTMDANGSGTGAFSETISGLSLDTHYYVQAYAINPQGTSYGGVEEFTTQNMVSSITRSSASPTNASSVSWDVAFGGPVTGLSASNFTLVSGGSLAGASITSVSGSGTSWTVTASTGTGSGTLGLNLTSAAGLNNGLYNLPFTGEVYTLDRTAPTVTISQAVGQLDPTNSSPIHFSVVFNKSVTGFDASDVALSGAAGATTAAVTGSGTTYDVAVSGMTASGEVILNIPAGAAQDAAGNANTESNTFSITYDSVRPTVTVEQAAAQADPTNTAPIHFTVTFSEAVTGFDDSDVILGGTAGATTAAVTGSGTTYDVAVSGMTANGTVTASVADGAAQDAAGNDSTAAAVSDNQVIYDTDPPGVTVSSTATDPTNLAHIPVTIIFDEAVTGFTPTSASGDVVITNGTGSSPSGSGTIYTFTVTPSGEGAVTVTVPAASCQDAAGNANTESNTLSITYDSVSPTVTIEQAAAQADPTNAAPIHFTVTFSEAVMGFHASDAALSGSAGATTAAVTGSGTTYDVAVSGMTALGEVILNIAAGAASDAAGNDSTAAAVIDNQVIYDADSPGVTVSSTAADPTNLATIPVTITFDEAVTGFTPSSASGDVVITNGTDSNPAGSGTAYTFDLTPSGQGAVTVMVPAVSGQDAAGNANTESNTFSITYDSVRPTVTVEQAAAQADPTNAAPIHFTVTFSEAVTGFDDSDVTLGGGAGATTAVVTGSGTTYDVAVSGMTANGTVTASVADGAAQDAALNTSEASTSADNEVNYVVGPVDVTIEQAAAQVDPTNSLPVNFTVTFGRAIDPLSFTAADLTLSSTGPGALAATLTEIAPNDGTTFNAAVNGLTAPGTVTVSLAADKVQDTAGNNNSASSSTDNSVHFDASMPTVSKTSLKSKLTSGFSSFTVEFSEAVSDPAGDTAEDDVTNPANYLLINKGPNGVTERAACVEPPPPGSDDIYLSTDQVVYDSSTFTATVTVNGGAVLPTGKYVVFVCGTTSIVDLAGNPINNGLMDFTYEFRVAPPAESKSEEASSSKVLPLTGFAPGKITELPVQPGERAYFSTRMVLEIPALSVNEAIVGVPESEGWDVTWLGDQIGYLGGTAFPTWAGNSVLTGHATDANGGSGPFARLGSLIWGDKIVIHAFGQDYIYEVRSVNRWTDPKDVSVLSKHEELPWLTLITCNGYDEKTGTYRWRTVVRAVQMKVVDPD